jgi:hypothetical protein
MCVFGWNSFYVLTIMNISIQVWDVYRQPIQYTTHAYRHEISEIILFGKLFVLTYFRIKYTYFSSITFNRPEFLKGCIRSAGFAFFTAMNPICCLLGQNAVRSSLCSYCYCIPVVTVYSSTKLQGVKSKNKPQSWYIHDILKFHA